MDHHSNSTPRKQDTRQRSLLNLLTATPEEQFAKQQSSFALHQPVVERIYQWQQLKQDKLAYQREAQERADAAARTPSHGRAASTPRTVEESDLFYTAQMHWLRKRDHTIESAQRKKEEASQAHEREAREQLVYTNARSRDMYTRKAQEASSLGNEGTNTLDAKDAPSSSMYPLLSLQRPVELNWNEKPRGGDEKPMSARAKEEQRIKDVIAYYAQHKRPVVLPREAIAASRSPSRHQTQPAASLLRTQNTKEKEEVKAQKEEAEKGDDAISLSSPSSTTIDSLSDLAAAPKLASADKPQEDNVPMVDKLTPRTQKALLDRLFYCHYKDPLHADDEHGKQRGEDGFCSKHNFHTFYDHLCTFRPEINPPYVSSQDQYRKKEVPTPAKTAEEEAEEKRQRALQRAQRKEQEQAFLQRQIFLEEARQAYLTDLQQEKERRAEAAEAKECTFTPQLSPRAQRQSGRRGLSAPSPRTASPASVPPRSAVVQEKSSLLEYLPQKGGMRKDITRYEDRRDVRLRRVSPRKQQTRRTHSSTSHNKEKQSTALLSETSLTLPSALSVSEASQSEDALYRHHHHHNNNNNSSSTRAAQEADGRRERYYYPFRHDKSPSAEKDAQRMAQVVWREVADSSEKKTAASVERLLSHFDKAARPPTPPHSRHGASGVEAAEDWPSIPSLPISLTKTCEAQERKRTTEKRTSRIDRKTTTPATATATATAAAATKGRSAADSVDAAGWPMPRAPSPRRTSSTVHSPHSTPNSITEESRLLALSDWWWTLVHYYYYSNTREDGGAAVSHTAPSADPLFRYEHSPFAMELPLELLLESLQTLLDEKRKKMRMMRQPPRVSYTPTGVASLWQEPGEAEEENWLARSVVTIELHYDAVAREGRQEEVRTSIPLTDNNLRYMVYAICDAQGYESGRHTSHRQEGRYYDYCFQQQLPMFVSFSVFISMYEWVVHVQTVAETELRRRTSLTH